MKWLKNYKLQATVELVRHSCSAVRTFSNLFLQESALNRDFTLKRETHLVKIPRFLLETFKETRVVCKVDGEKYASSLRES
jgi:hypothetical protein